MRTTSSSHSRRRFTALAATAGLVTASPSLLRAVSPVEMLTGRAFGTIWRITLASSEFPARFRSAVGEVLDSIDHSMSPWRSDSELARFNSATAGCAHLSPATLAVSAAALDIAAASAGRFDPTVGPLVKRWGFGPIEGAEEADWRDLSLSGGGIVKDRDGLTLDLCGIAKGHAVDRIGAVLAAAGLTDFLVDLGGELRSGGRHPSGRAWQVAIEDPRPDVEGVIEVLRLDGIAVATSGTRAQGYRVGDRLYGHIIDPLAGAPADGTLASVTVIADDAMTADGWATALAAAGSSAGPDLARSRGLDALFLTAGGGSLKRQMTGRFHEHIA